VFVHVYGYPRWLIAQGREEEAYRVLEKLHFDGQNREWLDGEFAEICEVSCLSFFKWNSSYIVGFSKLTARNK
jgi:hypothetical protein